MTPSTEQMARWWNILCEWKWPDDLPGKPEGFDAWPHFFPFGDSRRLAEACRYTVITPLMQLLEAIIGNKEYLRWHHLHNLQRTEKEFEDWWAKHPSLYLASSAPPQDERKAAEQEKQEK